MSLRNRLALSFLSILVLFGASQGATILGSRLRARSMARLEHALSQQVIIASLQRDLDNLHKEVTLLGQTEFADGEGKVDDETRRLFEERVANMSRQTADLMRLTDESDQTVVRDLTATFQQLAQAWHDFYANLGVRQGLAMGALVRADPLTRHMLLDLEPQLQREANALAAGAREEDARIAKWTRTINLSMFVISGLLAAVVAYLMSHGLSEGLGALRAGAGRIGEGDLDYQIPVKQQDELGAAGDVVQRDDRQAAARRRHGSPRPTSSSNAATRRSSVSASSWRWRCSAPKRHRRRRRKPIGPRAASWPT